MYQSIGCILLICLLTLSGCMTAESYKDNDTAAIVRGEKITIDHLRLLYPDDSIVEMMDEVVKAKLAEQEIKKMNIDVSQQIKENKEPYGKYPEDESHNAEAESIRSFADPQAKQLGLDPKKYYKKYTDVSAKMTTYTNAYIAEILGDIGEDEFGIDEYSHHASELLDDLVDQNQDEIEIRFPFNQKDNSCICPS